MPILMIALLVLGIFLVMGIMLFSATTAEHHTRGEAEKTEAKKAAAAGAGR